MSIMKYLIFNVVARKKTSFLCAKRKLIKKLHENTYKLRNALKKKILKLDKIYILNFSLFFFRLLTRLCIERISRLVDRERQREREREHVFMHSCMKLTCCKFDVLVNYIAFIS